MRRSSEFELTVKRGIRAVQPDLIVHVHRGGDRDAPGPRVGLIVTKRVGSAVDRHRVARRLRHVVRPMISDMDPRDRVVIRALANSGRVSSPRFEQQLRAGLLRAAQPPGAGR